VSDKARALKERTLAIEVQHATLTGGTLRDAEDANMRNLQRLEARKREGKKPAPKTAPRNFAHREITKKDLAAANVTKRVAPPKKLIGPTCKFCGHCRWCKRFRRTQTILGKARQGDAALLPLAHELIGLALAAQQKSDYRDAIGREYPFSRITGFTATRAVNAGIESVCDRSVSLLGAWR
jgi:hypothetical protein